MFISFGILPAANQSWSFPQPDAIDDAEFQGKLMWKAVTCEGAAKVLNLKEATMPKLDPAPRKAQKRSGFSVGDAITTILLARTTVAAAIQSAARP